MRSVLTKVALLVAFSMFAPIVNAADPAWPKEPKDFRDLPFGAATEQDVASKLKLDAAFCQTIEGLRTCIHHDSIGDVKTTEIFEFEKDRLVQVQILFKPDQYPRLHDIFVQRYGKPADIWTEPFETVGGGDHTNEILLWSGERMIVQIQRFAASIHESLAVIATREWYERTSED